MRHAAVVRALAVTLLAVPLQAQRDHGPPPSALANRCGSEVRWEPTLEAALAKAFELKRPVFWYVASVPGSPMDRKPVIDLYMRAGPFSMPDFVSAINRRFVPVKAAPRREDAKARKLTALAFIEPGFLILKPDGTEIARLDRIATFHELWLVEVLNRMIEGHGDLSRPSDAALKAQGPVDQAEALLLDGLWEMALRAAAAAAPGDSRAAYVLGRIGARLGRYEGAAASLKAVKTPEARVEEGLLALRREDWAGAEAILAAVNDGSRLHEARFLLGVARHRLGRQPDAVQVWKQLAESAPDSPWAAKAAAEVERYGPFGRGFEEYGYLPGGAVPKDPKDLAGTQRPRTAADADWLVRRSVRYLLERQNPDGGWDDSNYDFGGRDSLPDVWVAVTALNALALLEWSTIEPERTGPAIERAVAYLSNEGNVATENKQERVWAHSYRALFFSRLKAAGGPLAEKASTKLKDVVKRLEDLQAEDGSFAHEYPNPFATATALHALKTAELAGAAPNRSAFTRGATALLGSRADDGTFGYGFGRRGSKDVDMAAGRMPTCELALLLCGSSSDEKLAAAVQKSFERHAALEQVRKYDDHAPPHGIGGFFFWYDMFGRCLAIEALADSGKKPALRERQRKLMLEIAEIDGRFVDSHELGKPYGTAMALLCLKLTAPGGP